MTKNSFHLQPLSIQNCRGTWLSISSKISIIANDLQLNCHEYELQTSFATSKRSRILVIDIQPNCDKWGLGTWLPPNDENGVMVFDIYIFCSGLDWNMTWANSENTCIVAPRIVYLYWIWSSITWSFLFNNCFGAGHCAYLCSLLVPMVQIRYFTFQWSIYTQFVLNKGWKLDSHQMIIFVYMRSTCSVVELKTRFERWIARTEVNGVYSFDLQLIFAKYGMEKFRPTCDKIRSIYNHWLYKIVAEHDFR
jgi:hypothetical protein